MRKLYCIAVLFIVMLTGFQSCTKQSPDQMAPSSTVLMATITANQVYQLALDNSVSAGILKQASHFEVSHTALDPESGLMMYKYVPAANYTGTDEVVLSTIKASAVARTGCSASQGANGNNISYTTSYTTLKINVIDK